MIGLLFFIAATPILSLAIVSWAVLSRRLADGPRRATMVATILLACGVWTLVRTGGFSSDLDNDFTWRWAETPEEQLLAQAGDESTALRSAPTRPTIPAITPTAANWPQVQRSCGGPMPEGQRFWQPLEGVEYFTGEE